MATRSIIKDIHIPDRVEAARLITALEKAKNLTGKKVVFTKPI